MNGESAYRPVLLNQSTNTEEEINAFARKKITVWLLIRDFPDTVSPRTILSGLMIIYSASSF